MNKNRKGFAALEPLLLLVITAIIAATGFYVLHAKSSTDKLYDKTATNNVSNQSVKTTYLKSFDECAKAPGSKIQTSYPEICTAINGQQFTQSTAALPTPVPAEVDGHTTCPGGIDGGFCITANGKVAMKRVALSAKLVGWSDAPADLRQAITGLWPADCNGQGQLTPPSQALKDSNSILLNDDDNFAVASVGGCSVGGYGELFVRVNGQIRGVAYSQVGWDCELYDQYHVPDGFVADENGYAHCVLKGYPAIAIY